MVLEVEEEYPKKGGMGDDWIEMETIVQEGGRVTVLTHFEEGERVVVKIKKGWEEDYEKSDEHIKKAEGEPRIKSAW